MKKAMLIGASGDVGRGILLALAQSGWSAIAVGRSVEKAEDACEHVRSQFNDGVLRSAAGDLATEEGALQLSNDVDIAELDAVIVSISGPWSPVPLTESTYRTVGGFIDEYLNAHFNAAKVLVPRMTPGSVYMAIGGGMADAVLPGLAALSMAQAAQRNLVKGFAKELRHHGVHIRELMVAAMVNGHSTREVARPDWLTDTEIGTHAVEIISQVEDFPSTVIKMSSPRVVAPAK